MQKIILRKIQPSDAKIFHQEFKAQGWHKPVKLFEKYLNEQNTNKRTVVVAEIDGNPAGYATLCPTAPNSPFEDQNIPIIEDVNVLIKYQNKGIATKMLEHLENIAKQTNNKISIGVGLHSGYGAAQRLYIKRGYIPDGSGVWYKDKQLEQYADCKNDDNLILYLSKDL